MPRLLPIALALVVASVALGAAPAAATFTGVISDDMCAGTHTAMRMGPTDAACAKACVEAHDAKYVLVDGGAVYGLSDQAAAAPFAGAKVTVSGILDAKSRTIRVTSIKKS